MNITNMEQKPSMQARVTDQLYHRAQRYIPGSVQLFSKKPELYAPGAWPAYASKAEGCEVWDLDGNHYYDFSTNGVGACLLGYNAPAISKAAKDAIDRGCMSSLNSPEEVELAERLCQIHPWASKARFTRTGGESMAVAVRIARATTGRSMVAVCGYHGWHDWYLAANLAEDSSLDGHFLPGLEPFGVPRELKGTTHAFSFNDIGTLEQILSRYGHQLAAIVMEPCRYHLPNEEFIRKVKEGAERTGAMLIFDEITIGWRLCYGGSHLKIGVNPDIAVFAKALGNGHPMGAVIGTEQAMASARYSFISSTYWTESVGPAAALAVLEQMREIDVPALVAASGDAVRTIWQTTAITNNLPLECDDGFPCLPHYRFTGETAQTLKTLFSQYMLDEGFLAGTAFYPTLAHDKPVIEKYHVAVERVFQKLAFVLKHGTAEKSLKSGVVAQDTFARLVK